MRCATIAARFVSRCLAAAPLVLVVSALPARPQAESAASALARGETAIVAFLSGGSLTAEERAAIARETARVATSDPAEAARRLANAKTALAFIASGEPRKTGRVRELYRAYYESQPHADPERQIVERHDPTVAWDPAHALIVTARTMRSIRAAAAFASQSLGVAVPPDFDRVESRALAAGFAKTDFANKLAYARVESNMPPGERALEATPLAARKAALLKNGPPNGAVGLARDGVAAILYAAAQSLGTAAVGYGAGPVGDPAGGTNGIMHAMIDRQMRQYIFQIGHPQCSPTGANPNECQEAPILNPL